VPLASLRVAESSDRAEAAVVAEPAAPVTVATQVTQPAGQPAGDMLEPFLAVSGGWHSWTPVRACSVALS
jgi:hypothetical protein